MKLITYLCLSSLAVAIAIDHGFIRPLLNQKVAPDPLPIPGIIKVFTRHDRIPVAEYALGNNPIRNGEKVYGECKGFAGGHPNLIYEAEANSSVTIARNLDSEIRFERTLAIDREREESERRNGCWISLYGGSWHYVPAPATNYTTVAAILSQQIIRKYTVIRTPSELVPPGLHGHHWTIQANLDPEPGQWPERLVVSGESTGIWTHIGDGKYLWSKQP